MTYGTDVNNCPVAPEYIVDNNLKLSTTRQTAIDLVMSGEATPFTSVGLPPRAAWCHGSRRRAAGRLAVPRRPAS